MALSNEQRKHIRTRLQEIYQDKNRALTGTWLRIRRYSIDAMQLAEAARVALNARLAEHGVVIGPTVQMADIQCPEMDLYREQVDGAEEKHRARIDALKNAYNEALDELILGNDAAAVREVLERFHNFKID